MLTLRIMGRGNKDMKRAKKRGKDMAKFWRLVDLVQRFQPLEHRHRPHRLTGNWTSFWECHIEPDWLLIYRIDGEYLYLAATGTHSDLFG